MIKTFECLTCKKQFNRNDCYIKCRKQINVFCSSKCKNDYYRIPMHQLICKGCGKNITKTNSEYNKSVTKNFFCTHKCSTSYNNINRPKKLKNLKLKKKELLKNLQRNF